MLGLLVGVKVLLDSTGAWERINIPHIDWLFWPLAVLASARAATETIQEAEEVAAATEPRA